MSVLGRALARRKGLILLASAAALGGAVALDRLHPPTYTAAALVRVTNGGNPSPSPLRSILPAAQPMDDAVLRRAAGLLGWLRPETSPEKASLITEAVRSQLRAEWGGTGDVLRISVRDGNPDRAAAMANAVARAYVQTEEESGGGPQGSGGEKAVLQELRKAESLLEASEKNMKNYLMRYGDGESPTADELETQRNLLKALLKVYTPKHPEVVTTRAKISILEERLKKETEKESERQRLLREQRIAEDNVAFLSRKHKETLLATGGKVVVLDSPARVPGRPRRSDPRRAFGGPAGAGALVGFLLAVLLEAGRESPQKNVADRFADIPLLVAIPAVPQKSFAFFRGKTIDKIRRELIFVQPPESPLVEAYRTLRANLRLPSRPGGRPAPLLGVTSPVPALRKGLVSLNLCLMAARTGLRTLLIEGDIRRPLIHWLLGLPGEPGLADAAMGSVDWPRAVRGTSDFLFGGLKLDALLKTPGIENFRFLPGGALSASPSDILGSHHVDRILRETRAQFDLVVLNCPAFGPNADALQIVPKTDAVAIVHEPSDPDALVRAKDHLLNVKARIAGLILVPK